METSHDIFGREKEKFLTTLVHDEWLETIIAGHNEEYKSWHDFAAQLVLEVCVPEPRHE